MNLLYLSKFFLSVYIPTYILKEIYFNTKRGKGGKIKEHVMHTFVFNRLKTMCAL